MGVEAACLNRLVLLGSVEIAQDTDDKLKKEGVNGCVESLGVIEDLSLKPLSMPLSGQ